MVKIVSIANAKNHLTGLVREVEAGAQVVITKDRHPAVRLISEEEFMAERRRLQAEAADLEDQLSRAETGDDLADIATLATFVLAASAREWFATGRPEARRQILEAVGSNLVLRDKILTIEAQTPFRLIADCLNASPGADQRIEPPNSSYLERSFTSLEEQKNRVCALVEDVRTFFDGTPPLAARIRDLLRSHDALRDAA